MADLAKIRLNGNDYNFKDSVARATLENKQDVLTAGTNISIDEDGVISATGSASGGSAITLKTWTEDDIVAS